jgi:hypothetical protein
LVCLPDNTSIPRLDSQGIGRAHTGHHTQPGTRRGAQRGDLGSVLGFLDYAGFFLGKCDDHWIIDDKNMFVRCSDFLIFDPNSNGMDRFYDLKTNKAVQGRKGIMDFELL